MVLQSAYRATVHTGIIAGCQGIAVTFGLVSIAIRLDLHAARTATLLRCSCHKAF